MFDSSQHSVRSNFDFHRRSWLHLCRSGDWFVSLRARDHHPFVFPGRNRVGPFVPFFLDFYLIIDFGFGRIFSHCQVRTLSLLCQTKTHLGILRGTFNVIATGQQAQLHRCKRSNKSKNTQAKVKKRVDFGSGAPCSGPGWLKCLLDRIILARRNTTFRRQLRCERHNR